MMDELSIQSFARPYFYDIDDKPLKTTISKMKCKEHHKVYWEYDDKKAPPTYDGFVFTDNKGGVWYNQFPYASYGQLEDSQNRHVHLNDWDVDDKTIIYNMYNFKSYMKELYNGIHNVRKSGDENKANILQTHFDEVKELFEKQFGKKITIKPNIRTMYNNDNSEIVEHSLEGYVDVVIEDQEEFSKLIKLGFDEVDRLGYGSYTSAEFELAKSYLFKAEEMLPEQINRDHSDVYFGLGFICSNTTDKKEHNKLYSKFYFQKTVEIDKQIRPRKPAKLA